MQGFDNLITKEAYKIQIYSFSNGAYSNSNKAIEFPAFVTDFTDSYKSDWKPEFVYGRMDPIAVFKNTSRNIIVSFDIPNESLEKGSENMQKINFFIRGLYPIYSSGARGTNILSTPPMFRVKFANLVSNVVQQDNGDTLRTGLLCYIPSFDFKPKVDSGFFVTNQEKTLIPKLFSATLNLSIIHEHALGNKSNNGLNLPRINIKTFPHNFPSPKLKDEPEEKPTPKPPPPAQGTSQQSAGPNADPATPAPAATVNGAGPQSAASNATDKSSDAEEKVGNKTVLAEA
jgi:hypothetical protein